MRDASFGLLNSFRGRKVLIAGDVMLDEYVWGTVRRISPEAPVPVVEIERRSCVPGGAANTAANVVGLEARAMLLSVLGRDEAGRKMLEALANAGVAAESLLPDSGRITPTKTRIIAHSQQVVRIDSEKRVPLSAKVEDELLERAQKLLADVDACILSDYAKGVVTPRFARGFIDAARRAGKPVVVDPKGMDYDKYHGATVIKPNLLEAGQAVGRELADEESVRRAGEDLMDMLGGCAVLITRGAQGMSLFVRGRESIHIPAVASEVFDVTGAGDTVASTLGVTLAAGGSLLDAAHTASRAAAIVVGKVGTTAIRLEELLACDAPVFAGEPRA